MGVNIPAGQNPAKPRDALPRKLADAGGRRLACASMRLLDRYLLRELLTPLGYCLGGFLLLWITSDLLRQLDDFQAARLGMWDVIEFYAVTCPDFLATVFPMALLLALLYALTNHSRHHEITAIRAAGVSLWRLALPYFAVGFAGTVALFVLNEFAVPHSEERGERILHRHEVRLGPVASRNLVRTLSFNNAPAGRMWYMDAYNLKTREMLGPQVEYTLPDGSQRWLLAARALRTNDTWVFFGAREFADDPRVLPWLVPFREAATLPMPQFTETPEQIRSEINISSGLTLRRARQADIPIAEILDYLRRHPKLTRVEDYYWLHTKLQGRLAAPWTCLVVVLIAIPFGAASGRRNVFFGVAGSVFICFAYFITLQLGLAFGAGGYLPPWFAAWSPNLIFGLAGAWLTARVR